MQMTTRANTGERSGSFNPFRYLSAAAAGDIEAQRTIAERGIAHAVEHCDVLAAMDAAVFARLAAAHGMRDDQGRLLSILAIVGDLATEDEVDLRESLAAESLALISLLADDGEECADQFLLSIAEHSTPTAVELSKHLRAAMLDKGE
ncbi:hypothetical protein [Altererythrobacter sp. C41]|uniref:hypothetical protein n=1 Tax=Altererythrobacter sp. C41 TaxID=2806021 RepID=UPI00193167DD|nr:hypothetical protein [Altererythrobacter sp. C41]MBM0169670.1 hypothetical protein [Altererythrobacter sp. C41]